MPALARVALRQVLDAGPDPEASWLLSRALLQEGRIDEAASALGDAGGYGSDNPLKTEAAPHLGSAQCAKCHEKIHRAQQLSRHAHTFLTGSELERIPLPDSPLPDPADPKAIGSGDRGITPVGRGMDGRFRELRLSRYGDTGGWDVTAGQLARPESTSSEDLLGRFLSADDVRKCLGCHVTDFRAARDQTGPLAKETGIGCERCHGPGGNHVLAVAAEFSDLAIARPRLASAKQVTALCAECHSPRGRTVQPTDPDAVRFQGTTIAWSRCYQESQGRLSCITCHDPHHDADTSASRYEQKCVACHSGTSDKKRSDRGLAPTAAEHGRQVTCPVNSTTGCLNCHMPRTTSAVPHTTFTDHHIRVHGAADRVR
jgi:hypothetical protein